MISNPKYGWCNFDLENFHGTPSYITDIPFDLLDCVIQYIKTGCGSCWFDEEGTSFTLVLTPYDVYIISEKDNSYLYKFNINIENLIKEIINDIEKNIDNWDSFYYSNKELYKTLIESKIKFIKKEMNINEKF